MVETLEEMLEDKSIAEPIGEETFTPVEGYKRKDYSDSQVIVISNKLIGNMSEQITVQGESFSQYILFERERYFDGIDLKDKLLQIEYERADGVSGSEQAVNVEVSDQHIRFGWLIPEEATEVEGALRVMPYAYGKIDGKNYILKDLYVNYRVNPGLDISGSESNAWEMWETFLKEKLGGDRDTKGR